MSIIIVVRSTPVQASQCGIALVFKIAASDTDAVLALYRRMHPEMKPAELLIEITTDSNFWVRSVMLAERKPAKGKAPVYMYSFNWRTPVLDGKLMAPHAIDVRFHAVIGMKMMFGHQQLQGVKRRLDG